MREGVGVAMVTCHWHMWWLCVCVCAFVMVLQLYQPTIPPIFTPPTPFLLLLASEQSERDTLRVNAIEISLYLFIYLFIYLSVYGVRETSVLARASNYVS